MQIAIIVNNKWKPVMFSHNTYFIFLKTVLGGGKDEVTLRETTIVHEFKQTGCCNIRASLTIVLTVQL